MFQKALSEGKWETSCKFWGIGSIDLEESLLEVIPKGKVLSLNKTFPTILRSEIDPVIRKWFIFFRKRQFKNPKEWKCKIFPLGNRHIYHIPLRDEKWHQQKKWKLNDGPKEPLGIPEIWALLIDENLGLIVLYRVFINIF